MSADRRRIVTGRAADAEWADIVAWAIGQANAADLDEIRQRTDSKVPPPNVIDITSAASFNDGGDPLLHWQPGAETPHGYDADDGATFILDQPPGIPALWGADERVLWAEDEALMIAGGMGLGKTTLEGQLIGAQLGVGNSKVLGFPVREIDGRILLLAMDRPRQAARSMRRQFVEADRDALKARLVVRPGPPVADLAQNITLLTQIAEYYDAAVVYLDSLKDAAIGLTDDEVGAKYNLARQHLLKSGRQVCELHHVVKHGNQGAPVRDIRDVYGSTWLTAGCGSVILLTGEPGDPLIGLRHVKQPADEVGPFTLRHDQAAGLLSIEHEANLIELAASHQDGVTAAAAACAMFATDQPTRNQIEKARHRLDKLVGAGLLRRFDGTRGGAKGGVATAWYPSGITVTEA